MLQPCFKQLAEVTPTPSGVSPGWTWMDSRYAHAPGQPSPRRQEAELPRGAQTLLSTRRAGRCALLVAWPLVFASSAECHEENLNPASTDGWPCPKQVQPNTMCLCGFCPQTQECASAAECVQAGAILACLTAFAVLMGILGICYAARRRMQLRQRFHIAGSSSCDCCAWCCCQVRHCTCHVSLYLSVAAGSATAGAALTPTVVFSGLVSVPGQQCIGSPQVPVLAWVGLRS